MPLDEGAGGAQGNVWANEIMLAVMGHGFVVQKTHLVFARDPATPHEYAT